MEQLVKTSSALAVSLAKIIYGRRPVNGQSKARARRPAEEEGEGSLVSIIIINNFNMSY